MTNHLQEKILSLPLGLLGLAVILSTSFHFIAWGYLDHLYAASGFPVPYFEAQLSFSGAQIKQWYGELLNTSGLDPYIHTQYFDFVFIASFLLFHYFLLVLIARGFSTHSICRRALLFCATLSLLAPLADALENVVSFIMLANPLSFNDTWAIVYSSLASVKFVTFVVIYSAAILGALGLCGKGLVNLISHRLYRYT